MRVTCPGCEAVYDVPDAMAGSGRKLRCARCGEAWQPAGAHPAAAPPVAGRAIAPADPLLPPRPPAGPAIAGTAPRPRTPPVIWAALAASVVMLAGGAAALLLWPEPVASAWPPITRLYAALGVH